MIAQLTGKDFTELAPGELAIEHEGARIPLSVGEVRALSPVPGRAEPFALLLHGPAQPLLTQGTYTFVHPRLGNMDLFLVPLGRTADAVRYELIFS